MNLVGTDYRLPDSLRAGLEFAAPTGVAHPAFGTDELNARVARLARHRHPVRILVGDVVILDGVVETACPVRALSLDRYRAASFRVIGPLGGVEQVRAPVADDAAGIVPDPSEVEMDTILGIGRTGRRSNRPVLGAGLKDPAMLSDGFNQDLAFVNRERGLLALHVFACPQGHDTDQGV